MKTTPKTASVPLLALAAVLSGPALAAEQDGHKVELRLRGIHFDRAFDDDTRDRSQTALGIQLNYESPYLADFIGVGISGYGVQRIDSTGFAATDVLKSNNRGGLHDEFSKIGQAFVKLKYRELGALKLGRQLHNSLLLSSSTSRAIPNTYSGGSAILTPMKDVSVYGAVYDRWSRRADSRFEEFATDRSREGAIDYVGLLGATYKSGPVAVNFEYLKSKDFLEKFGLVGAYTFTLADKNALKLSGGIHTSRDAGKLFVTSSENSELDDEDKYPAGARSDNDGRGVYLDLEWNVGNVMLGGAVAKFDGAWIEDNFTGDHGTNPFPTGGVLADMTNNDETLWMVRAGYDWKDYVKGLKTTVKFKQGKDARNSHVRRLGEADEEELEVDVRYQIPLIKGLNFRYRYLQYTSDKVGRVDGVLQDNTDHRVYLDYSYRFF